MNGLLHEIIKGGWIDQNYIDDHVVGFDELRERVKEYPAERVAEICDVPAKEIREAARVLGGARRLLSTVLQGFYQSHQATAAAVQVNARPNPCPAPVIATVRPVRSTSAHLLLHRVCLFEHYRSQTRSALAVTVQDPTQVHRGGGVPEDHQASRTTGLPPARPGPSESR